MHGSPRLPLTCVTARACPLPRLPLTRAACVQHFVAYDIDSNFYNGTNKPNYRLEFDANVTAADLAQTYAPGFKALIQEADVQTIMCRCNARICCVRALLPTIPHPRTSRAANAFTAPHTATTPSMARPCVPRPCFSSWRATHFTLTMLFSGGALPFVLKLRLCSINVKPVPHTSWPCSSAPRSDGGAVGDIYRNHNYTKDLATAAAAALNAGVDLNSGGAWSGFAYLHLNESLKRGLVTEGQVRVIVGTVCCTSAGLCCDGALTSILHALALSAAHGRQASHDHPHEVQLRSKVSCSWRPSPDFPTLTRSSRLGLFDPPSHVRWSSLGLEQVDTAYHRSLARQYARGGSAHPRWWQQRGFFRLSLQPLENRALIFFLFSAPTRKHRVVAEPKQDASAQLATKRIARHHWAKRRS